ncbi:hypothetical protein [Streptomyces lunaelactis]|uniref:hypothetical protein n=1 Tax=Streptomyces lunaelactis TaxID=1535768 RepID=UPI001585A126|nr:hypothetical protein [Streptomyces lunaelactis]NUL27505.1 hypothetical protein [Streptomyces lunaelactis]
MPQFFDLDPTVRPVRLSARPADTHPYDFDPAAVRIVRADRVRHGDVVLGEVYGYDPAHTAEVSYLPYGCVPYAARPRPVDPQCPCELCRQHRADPFTYLTSPMALTVWPREGLDPVCQLNNADEYLVVVPARWATQGEDQAPAMHYSRADVEQAAEHAFACLRSYFDFSHQGDRRLFTGAVLAFLDDANSPYPYSSHAVEEDE